MCNDTILHHDGHYQNVIYWSHHTHIYINFVYTIINLSAHLTVKCNSHGSMMVFNMHPPPPTGKKYTPHYNVYFHIIPIFR